MPERNQRPYPPRRRRRRRRRRLNYTAIIFWLTVLLLVVGIVALFVSLTGSDPEETEPGVSITQTTGSTEVTEPSADLTEASNGPAEPDPVTKVADATVAATGDILMHMPCVRPAALGDGTYDFTPYFVHVGDYIQAADYAVANLETTLAGLDGGYEYKGYPNLNTPDDIVTALQETGFDMLLTANNHTYDTQTVGFFRTQQVLKEYGMDHTGTISDPGENNYLVKEINGISIGMICYTYETNPDPDKVALNGGATFSDDLAPLINTFYKTDVETFSENLEQDIAAMRADGAEAIVLYIHWGEEYQLTQNAEQEALAQAACDLGVDVIVGGHPHVIQLIDLLTATEDPEHKTVCLYSTGNTLSNQRLGNISYVNTAHTEDGILFSFSFAKYSDGTVRVEEVELLPLWVNMHTSSVTGKTVYDILPLDTQIEDWKSQFGLTDSTLSQAEDSYDRTMEIVGEGLAEVQAYLDGLTTP